LCKLVVTETFFFMGVLFSSYLTAEMNSSFFTPELVQKLVLHRGFHYPNDDLRRPLENTADAYLEAINRGFLIGECDVSITKDEVFVLFHDSTMRRLGHQEDESAINDIPITELTWDEIQSYPLKNNGRVSALYDVFQSLRGTEFKLAVELKAGELYAERLVHFFVTNPGFLRHVCLFMSFDWELISQFKMHLHDQLLFWNTGLFRNRELPRCLGLFRNAGKEGYPFLHLYRIENDDYLTILQNAKPYNLDGYYIHYTNACLEFKERMQEINQQYFLGIWGGTPDNIQTCTELSNYFQYVNTDLPDDFFSSAV